MKQLSITRTATLENLPALLDAAEQACLYAGANEDERHAVRLAVEEVSVNVMTHGYANESPGPITLALDWARAPLLTIDIIDRARVFDPATVLPPSLDTGWDERPIGGLGWHLVRQMVDEVRYRPAPERGNHLTLVKQIHS
ncbi:MAG: ATP-binding protein [Proteobacteria bacterium]|nr:ATP-binding protein [Pseudomonadota bacterium]